MKSDIRNLLEKYFEGDTTAEEEKVLRHYFVQDDMPEELNIYSSLFRYLEDESTAIEVLNEIRNENSTPIHRKHLFLSRLRSIAAVAAVLIAAFLLLYQPHKISTFSNENYVWVNGTLITEPSTVTRYAETSFSNVEVEADIIEEQLRFMFE